MKLLLENKLEFNDDSYQIKKDALVKYDGDSNVVIIPEGIKEIRNGAFYNISYVTHAVLPSTIEKIGKEAFKNTSLKSINLPEGLTSIGSGAFHGCRHLEKIKLPKSLISIGSAAFRYTGIAKVILPPNLEDMESAVFRGCEELTEIIFPKKPKFTVIPKYFAIHSPIIHLKIPEGIRAIMDYAFASTKTVILPKTLGYAAKYSFMEAEGVYLKTKKPLFYYAPGFSFPSGIDFITDYLGEY